jgi:hypothetical protein
MQKTSSSTKTVIIFVVILIIGALMYFYTLGGPDDASITSLDQQGILIGGEDTQIIGARVLSLLNEINTLRIDKSIFDDPVYKILLDHTVQIPEQNVGRANPFEPYSSSIVTPGATTGN